MRVCQVCGSDLSGLSNPHRRKHCLPCAKEVQREQVREWWEVQRRLDPPRRRLGPLKPGKPERPKRIILTPEERIARQKAVDARRRAERHARYSGKCLGCGAALDMSGYPRKWCSPQCQQGHSRGGIACRSHDA